LKKVFFLIISSGLILSALLAPFFLRPIYIIWMTLATIIGWVMTRVILIALFYFVVTPIGLISRLFGKQFLELKWNKSQESFWNIRPKVEPEKRGYQGQF
tara:strand:- start:60 stop:359 length:300 start_codon:yes stop_codon:yes gene_type:complete